MAPGKLFLRYLVTLAVFLAIDAIWLGFVADDFYQQRIGHLLGPVNWGAALLFYLIYIAGILFLAVQPSAGGPPLSMATAALRGAALGFVAYATYDLTNLATLKGWPVDMVVIDIAWGTFLTGSVAAVSCGVCSRWIR